MTIDDARESFVAALNAKTAVLVSEIERMIVDHRFAKSWRRKVIGQRSPFRI